MRGAAKTILIGSAGLAAAGAISYGVTDYLMRVALDREMPRLRNPERARAMLCAIPDAERFFSLLDRSGEALEGEGGCQPVSIRGYDGQRLAGHWRPCREERRVIVAMHGWRSRWSRDFGLISRFWHNAGCSVLYAEQRGQNNSGGDYMGFGLLERFDCRDWARWVSQRRGENTPIYLAGVSMGATTVLMASGLELPSNVRGIIADCGFTSPNAIWKHVAEHNLHLSYGLRRTVAEGICRRKIKMGPEDYSTTEALGKNGVPVLFIHGTDDHFVPVEMTYENYKACAAPKRLLVVPGADHGMSYLVDSGSYQAALLDFWREFDRPPGKSC